MKRFLRTLLTLLKRLFRGLLAFLVEWNEFITVPLSLLLFAVGGLFIRRIDPTAGLYDSGIFQALLFAVAAFLLLHGVAWFIIKITLPGMFKFMSDFLDRFMEPEDEFTLKPIQKCVLGLSYLFACLLGMLLILKMLF
jgi:hypothetical protein